VLLPLVAVLLNFEAVDARVVIFAGIVCVIAACVGNSFLTSVWDGGTFLLWQGLQALGGPLIVLPLLMISVNTIKDPADGPFASTLVNTMRAVAEPVGVWMLQLIMRWRGALHYNRIVDQSGHGTFSALQQHSPASTAAFRSAVRAQATVLTFSDAFLIIAWLPRVTYAASKAGNLPVSINLAGRTRPRSTAAGGLGKDGASPVCLLAAQRPRRRARRGSSGPDRLASEPRKAAPGGCGPQGRMPSRHRCATHAVAQPHPPPTNGPERSGLRLSPEA